MSYVNIGTLLDEFNINVPSDFFRLGANDKSIFISRIRSSATQSEADVITELKRTPGLKMHFQVRRLPEGGWQNIPNATFARKISFFASKSIITLPFNEFDYRKKEDIEPFLELLCTAHPFLKQRIVNILPSHGEIDNATENKLSNKYGLVSANFHLDDLEFQFEEKVYPTVVANLLLPYFHPINPEDVIHLRNEEEDMYRDFERGLSRLLNGETQLDHEKQLLSELEQIDHHVHRLNIKYKQIQDACRKKNIYMLIGFATVGLVMLLPPNIVPTMAAILGGGTLFEYFKFRVDEANKATGFREEEYYLLWRLSQLKEKTSNP